MLRPSPTPSHQLPQEEMWTHQPAAPKEEAQVDDTHGHGEWYIGVPHTMDGVGIVLARLTDCGTSELLLRDHRLSQ
jgi:hypothetical protein